MINHVNWFNEFTTHPYPGRTTVIVVVIFQIVNRTYLVSTPSLLNVLTWIFFTIIVLNDLFAPITTLLVCPWSEFPSNPPAKHFSCNHYPVTFEQYEASLLLVLIFIMLPSDFVCLEAHTVSEVLSILQPILHLIDADTFEILRDERSNFIHVFS